MTALSQGEIEPNDLEQLRTRLAYLEGEVVRLRAQATRLETVKIFESAADGFVVYDSIFQFTYLNSDAERLFQKTKADLLGKTQWSVFPETLGSEIEVQYRRAMSERAAVTLDYFYEGLSTWLEVRISPSTAGGLLVWLRDISGRRQADQQREGLLLEIQSDRQMLKDIIEQSPVAISVVRSPDFVYELVNPAYRSLARNKEVLGHRVSDVWGLPDVLLAKLQGVIDTGCPFEAIDTHRIIQRNPEEAPEAIFLSWSWIPLMGPAGVADRVLTLAVETTERKRQEDKLLNSEALLRRAQRIANIGSWEQDLESDEIQFSADACRIFGIKAEDSRVTMESLLSQVHPEDRELVHDSIRKASGRGECSQIDYRISLPDGTERSLRQSSEAFGDDGSRGRVLGTVQDVTEHKDLEEKLRRSQRLEGIARLAGGVAHDFNNLLVVINGYATMIVDELKADDPLREYAHEIINAGDRAAGLTRQLLAFSRKQTIRPLVFNLDSLLAEYEKMLCRLIREDITMTRNATPDLWSIRADPGQVEQVIMNLVVNARDAMPQGGVLKIEASNTDLSERDLKAFTELRPGRYVLLTVTDSGTGMTSETKRRLFEPFFTTKPVGEGTGLGLSTVYGIVKQHGGEIFIRSEIGLGSTFGVYWPAAELGASVQGLKLPVVSLTAYRGSETILLVEDDARVRKLIRKRLLSQGYRVLESDHSSDAIGIASKHPDTIDLLLTDIVMPQMSGRELAEQVRSLRPGIKVVFMSGYPAGATSGHGTFEPDVLFLQKPFTDEALGQILRRGLGCGANTAAVVSQEA